MIPNTRIFWSRRLTYFAVVWRCTIVACTHPTVFFLMCSGQWVDIWLPFKSETQQHNGNHHKPLIFHLCTTLLPHILYCSCSIYSILFLSFYSAFHSLPLPSSLPQTLLAYKQYPAVPHQLLVSKRLSQCLHPNLPGGVHLKALDVYRAIFDRIGTKGLSEKYVCGTIALC